MIRRIGCFIVECDDCRAPFGDDDGGVYHFSTDREALDYLAESAWIVTAPGRLRCPSCTAHDVCADHGHQWGPWHVCACRGEDPDHHVHGCGLFRICHRCAHSDDATLATLPTTDQPHAAGS